MFYTCTDSTCSCVMQAFQACVIARQWSAFSYKLIMILIYWGMHHFSVFVYGKQCHSRTLGRMCLITFDVKSLYRPWNVDVHKMHFNSRVSFSTSKTLDTLLVMHSAQTELLDPCCHFYTFLTHFVWKASRA